MELAELYKYDLVKINPPENDFLKLLNIKEYQPNIYSNKYFNKESKIIDKYTYLIKSKKKKTYFDKLLKHELDDFNKTSIINEIFFPVDISDNIYVTYIFQSIGDNSFIFNNNSDYNKFNNRLKMIPKITNSIINLLNEGIQNNQVYPTIIINYLLNYFNNVLENQLYKHNKRNKNTKSINKSITKYLVSSILKIKQYLENTYINHTSNTIGYCNITGGKQYYINLIRYYTLSTITPDKILNVFNSTLPYILNKINNIIQKLKFKGTYHQFVNYILYNRTNKFNSKKEFLDYFNSIQDKINTNIITKYFNTINTDISYNIRFMSNEEPLHSPYFTQYKKGGKGVFNFYEGDIKHINKQELFILCLHEGNPGHNYEMICNADKNDYVITNYYPGYSEGWAFYVEQLHNSNDIYILLYQYIYDLHRLIRLYIDTGIHYYNKSLCECKYFMKKYCFMRDSEIDNELIRYISSPGQALTYYIGRDIIQRYKYIYLKKKCNTIKGFHEKIFNIGPCPLDIFEKELIKIIN